MTDFDDYLQDLLITQYSVSHLLEWKISIEKSLDLKKEDYNNIEKSLVKLDYLENKIIDIEKKLNVMIKTLENFDKDLYDRHFYDFQTSA